MRPRVSTIPRLLAPFAAFALLTAGFLTAGCGSANADKSGDDGRIHAVVTIGQIGDLVRQVGGEHVRVTQLMGAGDDPHTYVSTEADVRQLGSADIIFYNGMHLEGRMTDIFARMAKRRPTVAVSERIPEDQKAKDDENHLDPHIWFDVRLWMTAVEVVRDELAKVAPDHAEVFTANAGKLLAEMEELDGWVREQIASIPKEQRVLVTAHDAFGYFGRAYDIEVKAIQGISTEDEASNAKIAELAKFIAERKIKAVFVESTISIDTITSLLDQCEAPPYHHKVTRPVENDERFELFSDAMGPVGTETGTYVGMVRHNVTRIVAALR